jgi:hypothetical protein
MRRSWGDGKGGGLGPRGGAVVGGWVFVRLRLQPACLRDKLPADC